MKPYIIIKIAVLLISLFVSFTLGQGKDTPSMLEEIKNCREALEESVLPLQVEKNQLRHEIKSAEMQARETDEELKELKMRFGELKASEEAPAVKKEKQIQLKLDMAAWKKGSKSSDGTKALKAQLEEVNGRIKQAYVDANCGGPAAAQKDTEKK